MKKLILCILLVCGIVFNQVTYASEDISPVLVKAYNKFSIKVQKKYSTKREIEYFKKLDKQLVIILEKKKLSAAKKKLILDLRKLNNEKIFSIEYSELKKKQMLLFSKFEVSSLFDKKIDTEENVFLENGVWYTYRYNQFLNFPKGTKIDRRNLDYNNIDYKNDIVFINDNSLGFVKNYEKVKLISDDIIYGIPDKLSFLAEVKDDKTVLTNDTDEDFRKLKSEAEELGTKNRTSSIIKKVYSHVIGEVEYTKEINLSDAKIFSGIETHNNSDGVCEGYTKLMKYLLNFSGISNVEVIRGYVIDAQDFPKIGHAWIKIGDNYYDPTFDDPLGLINTRTYKDYRYYGLPKDLFYTNRYEYGDIDESLKTKDLGYRTNLVKYNIAKHLSKYQDKNYNLLKPFEFRSKYGLNPYEVINISKLKSILPYYEVNNFVFTDNGGKSQTISKLVYFNVTDSDIENILSQFNYNTKGFFLFHWNQDGKISYRLAHSVEF